jgi:GNAT superfamily N-acetyltransferase
MRPTLVIATEDHAQAVSELVRDSFGHFVAPDWRPDAREVFYAETSAENLCLAISSSTYAAVASTGDGFAGFVLMPSPSLLGMLFVRPQNVRQGIGTFLWEAARAHVEAHYRDTKTVELNASPYAVAAYRAMGFFPISESFRRSGSLATRMACWLPGRALAQSSMSSPS